MVNTRYNRVLCSSILCFVAGDRTITAIADLFVLLKVYRISNNLVYENFETEKPPLLLVDEMLVQSSIFLCYRVSYKQDLCDQGIINFTGSETFPSEPKFAKLLREHKLTPWCHKKSTGFSRMSVTLNLLLFGALLRDNL